VPASKHPFFCNRGRQPSQHH